MNSMVYLVGAGPGDPGLITEKGRSLLEIADVVVYDSLINTKLLDHCSKKAKFIFVGKKSSRKSITQIKKQCYGELQQLFQGETGRI